MIGALAQPNRVADLHLPVATAQRRLEIPRLGIRTVAAARASGGDIPAHVRAGRWRGRRLDRTDPPAREHADGGDQQLNECQQHTNGSHCSSKVLNGHNTHRKRRAVKRTARLDRTRDP